MPRFRKVAAVVAGATLLAVALAGCQFIGDVYEGERLTNERLAVDAAMRQLVGELEGIDGVESVEYRFDAADVSSSAALQVRLAADDAAAWQRVVSAIVEAGDRDAMAGYPITADLASASVEAYVDSQYGADWLTRDALSLAADAASAFGGAPATVSGVAPGVAMIATSADASAEELLSRIAGDPTVMALADRARAAGSLLSVSAAGIELSGVPASELLDWARAMLAPDVPRLEFTTDSEPQEEWVIVSLSGGEGASVSASWAGAAEPGSGSAWDAFVSALKAGPLTVGGECAPVFLSYAWPGIGQQVSAAAMCDGSTVSSGASDRPGVEAVRVALEAEGVLPEDLGFTIS